MQQGGALGIVDSGDAPLSSALVQPDLPLVVVVPGDADVPRIVVLFDPELLVDGLGPAFDDNGVGAAGVGLLEERLA